MITIIWTPVYHERRAYLDASTMLRHSIRDEEYALGCSKPNYPMPTRIGEISITPWYVDIYPSHLDHGLIKSWSHY